MPHRHVIRTRVAPGLRGAPHGQAGKIERAWNRHFPTRPQLHLTWWGLVVGGWHGLRRAGRWWKRYADMTVPYTAGLLVWWFWPFPAAAELGAVVAVFGLWPAHLRLGPVCRRARWVFSKGKVLLDKMNKVGGFEPLPFVYDVDEKPHILVYDVHLADGTDPQLWTKQRRALGVAFRKPLDFVPLTDHHWKIIVTLRDLLGRDPVFDPEHFGAICDDRHIWCYIDWNGDICSVPIDEAHWLIGGATRSGKSTTLNAMLCQLIRLEHTRIHFIDPQHGISFSHWWDYGEVAKTAREGVEMLERMVETLARRGAWMAENRLSLIRPSADVVRHIIVIDEAAQLLAVPDKDLQKRAVAALHNLTATGLKAAVNVIMATQDPRDGLIPTEISNQFTQRFGLACQTWQQSNIILGGALAGAGWNLADIPAGQPGRGIHADGRDIRRCRYFRALAHDLTGYIERHRPADLTSHTTTFPDGTVVHDTPLPAPSQIERVDGDLLSFTTGDRIADVKLMLSAAGPRGVSSAEVALRFGVDQRTAQRYLGEIRDAGGCEARRGRWFERVDVPAEA